MLAICGLRESIHLTSDFSSFQPLRGLWELNQPWKMHDTCSNFCSSVICVKASHTPHPPHPINYSVDTVYHVKQRSSSKGTKHDVKKGQRQTSQCQGTMFQHNGRKTSGFYEKDFKPIHQEKAHCIKEPWRKITLYKRTSKNECNNKQKQRRWS